MQTHDCKIAFEYGGKLKTETLTVSWYPYANHKVIVAVGLLFLRLHWLLLSADESLHQTSLFHSRPSNGR